MNILIIGEFSAFAKHLKNGFKKLGHQVTIVHAGDSFKKINKTQLSEKSGITTNEMAKMGKNEMVKMETLVRICKVLACTLDDIVEMS